MDDKRFPVLFFLSLQFFTYLSLQFFYLLAASTSELPQALSQ